MLEYEKALWSLFLAFPYTLSTTPLLMKSQRFLKQVLEMAWTNKNNFWHTCMPWRKNFIWARGLKSSWPWAEGVLWAAGVRRALICAIATRSSYFLAIWRQLFLVRTTASLETALEHAPPCDPSWQLQDSLSNCSIYACSLWLSKLASISTSSPLAKSWSSSSSEVFSALASYSRFSVSSSCSVSTCACWYSLSASANSATRSNRTSPKAKLCRSANTFIAVEGRKLVEWCRIALKRTVKRSYNVYLIRYAIVLCIASVVFKILADEVDETTQNYA